MIFDGDGRPVDRVQKAAERALDPRHIGIGLSAAFEFIGGVLDGEEQDIPLAWLTCRVSGAKYALAVIENPGSDPPIKYVLVHESMIPKEQRA